MGVIRRTEEPTDWVNALVIVEKPNGSLRLCMDPTDLNAHIKREHYQRSLLIWQEHIYSHGFYQMQLDEASTMLCTMATPYGRYSFKGMPYGISSAPENFHKTINRIMEGLGGVGVFIDDILIWGCSKEEHDRRLLSALERMKETNLKLNKSKCEICV